jgi:hypothetical protein
LFDSFYLQENITGALPTSMKVKMAFDGLRCPGWPRDIWAAGIVLQMMRQRVNEGYEIAGDAVQTTKQG